MEELIAAFKANVTRYLTMVLAIKCPSNSCSKETFNSGTSQRSLNDPDRNECVLVVSFLIPFIQRFIINV